MKTIHELESEIRDFVNSPRKQATLLKSNATWGMLCSSLDVIGDTECALAAYLVTENSPGKKEDYIIESGNLYLTLYAVLQVLFVQDDAVKHLHESLGLARTPNATVTQIREVRNDVIGHPTKRDRKGGGITEFCCVSRPTLSRSGCEVLTMRADGTSDFKTINIREMVEQQREAVKTWLSEIIAQLKAQEMAHRDEFKGKKLADAFPQTLGYYHEKIGETIDARGQLPRTSGAGLLESIQGNIQTFKEGLQERGIADAYDAVNYVLEELDYPMKELSQFLQGSPDSKLNERDADIFHFFIRRKLEELIRMAHEIDADYDERL
jgi:hypothetical protein